MAMSQVTKLILVLRLSLDEGVVCSHDGENVFGIQGG